MDYYMSSERNIFGSKRQPMQNSAMAQEGSSLARERQSTSPITTWNNNLVANIAATT
jgi:hypothetical protein